MCLYPFLLTMVIWPDITPSFPFRNPPESQAVNPEHIGHVKHLVGTMEIGAKEPSLPETCSLVGGKDKSGDHYSVFQE